MAALTGAVLGCESAEEPAKSGPSDQSIVADLPAAELQDFCAAELKRFDAWPQLPTCATPTGADGKPLASDANLTPAKPTLEGCVKTPPRCSVGVVRKCWTAWAKDPCTMTQQNNACAELYDCVLSQTVKEAPSTGKCENEAPGRWYCRPMQNDKNVYLTARVVWDPSASNLEKGWRVHLNRLNDLPWWQDWGNWGTAYLNLMWVPQTDVYPQTSKLTIPREMGDTVQSDILHLPVTARYVSFSVSGFDEWTPWALWTREFSNVWFELNDISLGWQSGDIYLQFHYKPY